MLPDAQKFAHMLQQIKMVFNTDNKKAPMELNVSTEQSLKRLDSSRCMWTQLLRIWLLMKRDACFSISHSSGQIR